MTPARFSLALLVSGRCNLHCSYCYQDARACRAEMSWPTARAALDHLLASGADQLNLELTGGEPLRAPGLVRRCIRYARRAAAGQRDLKIVLATNGSLLTPPLLDYLEQEDVALRISMDGAAEANEVRAPGTFPRLDGLLDHLATAHPGYLRNSVAVRMTLLAQTVPHFAASVRYLAAKGVPSIRAYPKMTPDPDWTPGHSIELERQTDGIADFSVGRWQETGDVPVEFLRGRPGRSRESGGAFLCGGPTGNGFCVDPDGHAWACPMFAPSLRRLPPMALGPSSALDLGDAFDPALPRRLARLPGRARRHPLFTDGAGRHSSYATCRECELEGECFVCPAALCHGPDSGDSKRVPDALCAFNRATLKARAEFHRRTGGGSGAASREDLRSALKRLADALIRDESHPGSDLPRTRRERARPSSGLPDDPARRAQSQALRRIP